MTRPFPGPGKEETRHVGLRMPVGLHADLIACARVLTGGQLSTLILSLLEEERTRLLARKARAELASGVAAALRDDAGGAETTRLVDALAERVIAAIKTRKEEGV